LLDSDDFGGIEERMVAASSDEPSSNPSSEPSLVPSIQSKLRAIFEAICDVALLRPNEPSGARCLTGYWLAIKANFFFLSFNGSNDLLTHQKIEPGVSSVVESVGQDFW
jgi:hypothetical protein